MSKQACLDSSNTPGKLQAVTSIKLGQLDLDFTDKSVTLSSPQMDVGIMEAIKPPFSITGARQNVNLVNKGIIIATFNTPWVSGVMEGNTLKTSVGKSILNIIPERSKDFSDFISTLVVNPEHTFTLNGTAEVKLTISLPTPPPAPVPFPGFGGKVAESFAKLAPSKTFTVSGIAFSSSITLKGFNNFPDITYVEEISKTINDDGSFTIMSKVNIKNTSQLGVKMGDVYFKTLDEATKAIIGDTLLEQLELKRDNNFITVVTTSTNPADAAADIYKRVTEQGMTFRLNGFAESSRVNTVLAQGISAVSTTVVIPALKKPATDAVPEPAPAPAPDAPAPAPDAPAPAPDAPAPAPDAPAPAPAPDAPAANSGTP
ncbi:hypothetical protein BGZ96_006327 [Linnemannia gamsii]|uniref:Uncharacterized protein n=1 Tax=Linnemannia gamsii TaxID=64522 RepID=A0ABQ7K2M4_9FUNG|nr:hypothetical protein BGZ96_006327 [Linnemannia gamsii]